MEGEPAAAESLTAESVPAFPEYDTGVLDPPALAADWFAQAVAQGVRQRVREPRSAAFATAAADGTLTARILAVLALEVTGLEFATHRGSRKMTDIAAQNRANALFYWRELGRQLSLSGPVQECSSARADSAWSARPAVLDSMSVVSRQSAPLADPEALRAAERGVRSDERLPRPDRFRVFRLVPERIEFWAVAADRLHRRVVCRLEPDGWTTTRLHP